LVSGEDIRKYYNENNYESDNGELGNSCMRQSRKSKFFDIYVKNPEVCQLLILRSQKDENLIKGRSLIWKLNDGSYYQDRIYTNNNYETKLFEEWARERSMKIYKDDIYNIEVQLGDHEYENYPYMDTFVCYSPSKRLLSADEDLWPGQGFIKLQDTTGGYEPDDVVWSEVEGEYISKEDAEYVNISNSEKDWVYRNDVVNLDKRGLWYVNSYNVQWCSYEAKYFHKDDVVYSEVLGEYLFNYIQVRSIGGVDYIPSDLKNLYSIEIDGELYLRKSLVKNPETGELVKTKKELDKLSEEINLDVIKSIEIINNSYLNGEFDKSIIEKELKSIDYDFIFDIDQTIILLYANMGGGFFNRKYTNNTNNKKIELYISDNLKVDTNNLYELSPKLYDNWYDLRNVINNFSYWIFDKDVYKAYLYLNVL
jgi:hypothetical protein